MNKYKLRFKDSCEKDTKYSLRNNDEVIILNKDERNNLMYRLLLCGKLSWKKVKKHSLILTLQCSLPYNIIIFAFTVANGAFIKVLPQC